MLFKYDHNFTSYKSNKHVHDWTEKCRGKMLLPTLNIWKISMKNDRNWLELELSDLKE